MEIASVSSEEEMIAEWLLAEGDSPRYTQGARTKALAYRGWPDRMLFESFPRESITWHEAVLGPDDLERVCYIRSVGWVGVSAGTCRPTVAVDRLRRGTAPPDFDPTHIFGIVERLERGDVLPRIITLGPPDGSIVIVLEGTARITAYACHGFPDRLPVIHGIAELELLRKWRYFPLARVLDHTLSEP
jgi:hypothetical protein